MPTDTHRTFRAFWWISNILLIVSVGALLCTATWEYSVRRYLAGFAAAVVPANASPEQKVEAILKWMKTGPPRAESSDPSVLSTRDPETTLNYRQLLAVCGTATNAFLNVARTSNLEVRRLLLLGPDRGTIHVVAEVMLDDRWVIVDPTYRLIMRDNQGRLLTRKELKDPETLAEATSSVKDYPSSYNYSSFAHVRVARLPMQGLRLRSVLDWIDPNWDEEFDWSLLLERESFFAFFISLLATIAFLLLREGLALYADYRMRIPRFHLREHATRALAAFFTSPEIK